MARIRTIKPEFFRHEGLQDLEAENPHLRPMLVFAGLWCHADRNGVFPWQPRQIALDILPFLWSDNRGTEISEALTILEAEGFIERFEAEGKTWGFISARPGIGRLLGGLRARSAAEEACE